MYVCGFVYVGHKWDFMKSIDCPHCYTKESKEWKTGCGGGTYVFLLTPTQKSLLPLCSGSLLFVQHGNRVKKQKKKTVHFKWRLIPDVFFPLLLSAS